VGHKRGPLAAARLSCARPKLASLVHTRDCAHPILASLFELALYKSATMNEVSQLENEAQQATDLLKGKIVSVVWRHRKNEIGIEFTDGSRLFIDSTQEGVELSITEGNR
jgi:hypothetical protein